MKKTIAIYGITHALVDACCIATLYSVAINEKQGLAFILIVLYNILAFGLQSIIGDIFDKLKKPRLSAIIGCILTASAGVLLQNPIPAAVIAGIGNAFFHVGGGIICLKAGNGKCAVPGMYVAPGALGLFLGAFLVKNSICSPLILSCCLIISALIIAFDKFDRPEYENKTETGHNKLLLVANCLLIAIIIRSFIGLSISVPWKGNVILLFWLTFAVFAGKFFGGIIADKFGIIKVTTGALLISSPLVAFGINNPLLFITGIFFFNFTMPVTLTVLANMMKGREGFAFGLTTLALITGAFPFFAGIKLTETENLFIFLMIIISAVLIYTGLKNTKPTVKTNF